MVQKDRVDLFGAVALGGFALLLAFNQVVIKIGNDGFQPIFFAALRSFGGAVCIYLWMRVRGIELRIAPGTLGAGLLMGLCFTAEFTFLFTALDLTTVTRTSVIFYTMPVWLALAAHVLIPGERITRTKAAGLMLAFVGVTIAIVLRSDGGDGSGASLIGDLCALAASFAWAGIALCARATTLKSVPPEVQLLWQLVVSAPILLGLALLLGPLMRDPEWIHWGALGFQIVVVVSAGFLLWLWLLSIYPAASVAAFSFLSPVFGVGLGWLLLDEPLSWPILLSLVLVCSGLIVINRPPRRSAG
jgi:drug/metabolite transporter (DMT)-like permease